MKCIPVWILAIVSILSGSMIAQTFKTIVTFNGTNGAAPSEMSLIQGVDGKLFGTTLRGGVNDYGTIFSLSRTGKLITLYSFCSESGCTDGEYPAGSLVQSTDGYLYGTTQQGGNVICPFYTTCGTVYKTTRNGEFTSLYSFCAHPDQQDCPDGELPSAGLVQSHNGVLYGTTDYGGFCYGGDYGCGTVFTITRTGQLTTVLKLNYEGGNGYYPFAPLIEGRNGNLYGTTYVGGTNNGEGAVFELSLPYYNYTELHSFHGYDGSEFYGGVIEGLDGNLYGSTLYGGQYNLGTVFQLTPSGVLTTLHSFNGTDGSIPYAGVIQATDGNFYGTTSTGGTYDGGTVFQMSPSGSIVTLHSFDGSDGSDLNSSLFQATDGKMYGTTPYLSSGQGDGTIFSLDMGLSPFVAFLRDGAKAGQQFGILGQDLSGATDVSLNGIPAIFSVRSDTLIVATVPSNAKSGYVTVATPGTTLSSNVPFQVVR
jgi:uncharacterized repeat protein (TIGR03803 family)